MEHLINEKTVDNEYVNSKQTVCPACEGFSLVKSSNVRGRIKRKKPDIAGNNYPSLFPMKLLIDRFCLLLKYFAYSLKNI